MLPSGDFLGLDVAMPTSPYIVLKTFDKGTALADGRDRTELKMSIAEALDCWQFSDGKDGTNYRLVTMAGPDQDGEYTLVLLDVDK